VDIEVTLSGDSLVLLMERVKISLPSAFSFSTIIAIRITDLTYGGHAGNDVFLVLAHEARQQFLLQHNYSELAFGGTGLIMTNAAIEFKRELLYGNEVKISVAASGFDRLGFDIFYRMEIKVNGEWVLAAKVKTGMSCFDYATKKMVAVPGEAIVRLTS
jgi:acyl-CoA thioesterase FadM